MAELVLSDEDVDLLELLLAKLLAPRELPFAIADRFRGEQPLVLRDREGVQLAVLDGELTACEPIQRYDFTAYRRRPDAKEGPFLAFAARRPLHRAQLEALAAKARAHGARLLIIADSHGDPDLVRVRALQAALQHAPGSRLFLAPLSAAGEDPRLDAIIARNAGASFFAGSDELPVAPSPAQLERWLDDGAPFPAGFTFPEIEAELRRGRPLRSERGLTIFFTGLSGSGKSTLGQVLRAKLLELTPRRVSFLDGDVVRTHLSKGLGFSKEDRDVNIRRIGFVAAEITKHGGIAICAPIAPYDATRKEVRSMVEALGAFVLVYAATPLEECMRRDRKGLYAKALRGELKGFTGIDDPYEAPTDAEVTIDTTGLSREASAERVLEFLRRERYLAS